MTANQISEWIAYAELEPFGSSYESQLWGMLCSTIANFSAMVPKKGSEKKIFVPTDFIPDFLKEEEVKGEEKTKQTVEEMKSILMQIARRQNKRNKK